MANGEIRVRGYREFLRAVAKAQPDSRKQVRAALKQAGDSVRVEATDLFDHISAKSAAGYRVRVRQRGVSVEQSLRKTTGKRPDFGALQMKRALLPALARRSGDVGRDLELAIDRIADYFDTVGG